MRPDGKRPILTNEAYEFTKTFVMLILPVCSALYFTTSLFVDLPAVKYVLGGIALLSLLYGWLVHESRKRYLASDRDLHGEFVVKQDGGGAAGYILVLHADPEELADEERISFKVLQQQV